MPDSLLFPADFLLAQRCVEGDARAIRQFQDTHREAVMAYLQNAGATADEAEEVTEWLWSECLKERANHRPRLANYAGQASLKTWLHPLALNQLIARKRRQRFWNTMVQSGLDPAKLPPGPNGEESPDDSDAPLMDLLREAVQKSFEACPPEDFVLLQLAHVDQLQMVELALMFNCSKSKVNRDLARAGKRVAEATLDYIRQVDPWLVLTWADFVELCRVTNPACFGVE